MKVKNAVQATREQLTVFLGDENADRGPIFMVNLLKFREKAEYEDGRDESLSGREAYMRYGAAMRSLVEAAGGRIMFTANISFLLLGEVEDMWDMVAIAEYPSRRAMRDITTSESFREIEAHRNAGLEGQLNIECLATGDLD